MVKQTKSKRRILHKIQLTEISAVDRPCQEHAKMTIMKRASEPAASVQTLESQDHGDLAKALQTATFEFAVQEAHAVLEKAKDIDEGSLEWDENKHPRDDDGKFSGPSGIGARLGAAAATGAVATYIAGPVAGAVAGTLAAVMTTVGSNKPDLRLATKIITNHTKVGGDGTLTVPTEVALAVTRELEDVGWSKQKSVDITAKAIKESIKRMSDTNNRLGVAMRKAAPSVGSKEANAATVVYLSAILDELESMEKRKLAIMEKARDVIDKAWEESKHPRAKDGKFSGPGKITASRVIRGASAGLAAGTVGMVFGGPVTAALLAGVAAVLVGGPDTDPDMRAATNAIKASLSVTTANKDGKITTSKEIVQNVIKKLTKAGWSQEKANAIAIKAVDAVYKEMNKKSKLLARADRKVKSMMNKVEPSDDSKAVNEAIAFLSAMLDELESMQEDGNNEVKKFNSIIRNADRVLTKVYA